MYNQACPQTPAPARAGHHFPMATGILETPSIMRSFRESTVAYPKNTAPAPTEPPAMRFFPQFSSSPWNDSVTFGGNTLLPASGRPASTIPVRSEGQNSAFLDRSFTSIHKKPSTIKAQVPLATSNTNSLLNRSMSVLEKKSSAPSKSGFPVLGNFHRTQGSNLNATISLFSSSSAFNKRKYPEPTVTGAPAGPSKYLKVSQGNSKAFPATATTNDETKGTLDAKATLRIVTGTIDHLQKIIREQPKYPLLLETVANVLTVKPGSRPKEKVVLLRNRNAGPVLQALYYEIDADLPPLVAGDLVRCVGRIQPVGNRLQILKITRTTEQHDRAIARLQTVSAFTTKVRR
uniref:Uncharacterized protein n=1 Tax=Anopheles atroparvus TaxID=41427 RepID=A0A182JDM4_ANOAO